MTDLRDQLADHIPLTDRRGVGHVLWRIRTNIGMNLDALAHRLGISRSGVHRREAYGHMPTSALIDHAAALGYQVVLKQRPLPPGEMELGRRTPGDTDMWFRPTGTGWPDAGALTPDRRAG